MFFEKGNAFSMLLACLLSCKLHRVTGKMQSNAKY